MTDLLRDIVPYTGLVAGPLSALGLVIGIFNEVKNTVRRRRATERRAAIRVGRWSESHAGAGETQGAR